MEILNQPIKLSLSTLKIVSSEDKTWYFGGVPV
jgi:hypothetical protein